MSSTRKAKSGKPPVSEAPAVISSPEERQRRAQKLREIKARIEEGTYRGRRRGAHSPHSYRHLCAAAAVPASRAGGRGRHLRGHSLGRPLRPGRGTRVLVQRVQRPVYAPRRALGPPARRGGTSATFV